MVNKFKAEGWTYAFSTFLTIAGFGLVLAGLLMPYWYEGEYIEGIVVAEVNMGLWLDRVCMGNAGCEHHWVEESGYTRVPSMPGWELIRGFETAATIFGAIALVAIIPLWVCRTRNYNSRMWSYFFFYTPTMIAGFLSIIGTLVLASKGNKDYADFAPFLSGAGGASYFIAGCLACIVCRFDPTYGTLENPVSPVYIRS